MKRFPWLICWLLGGVFIFLVVFVHVSWLVFTVHELLDAQVRTHLDPEMFLSHFFYHRRSRFEVGNMLI